MEKLCHNLHNTNKSSYCLFNIINGSNPLGLGGKTIGVNWLYNEQNIHYFTLSTHTYINNRHKMIRYTSI